MVALQQHVEHKSVEETHLDSQEATAAQVDLFSADSCVLFQHLNQTANGSSPLENATSPVMEFWE